MCHGYGPQSCTIEVGCVFDKFPAYTRWLVMHCKLLLEVIPKMLNGIEIRGLSRPHHDLKIVVFQPGFCWRSTHIAAAHVV